VVKCKFTHLFLLPGGGAETAGYKLSKTKKAISLCKKKAFILNQLSINMNPRFLQAHDHRLIS